MRAVSLVLLLWLYALSIQGLMDLFSPLLGINYPPLYISLMLSLVGLVLGLVFYAVSLLKSTVKRYIKLGIPGFILLLMLGTYLIAGASAFLELFIFLVKIGFILMMCAVTLVGCYGLFKKQRNTILAAGAGVMFFFFFTKILLGDVIFSVDQIEILLLFFIMFVCFLELGTTSIYFSSVVNKMMPNENTDEIMLSRFNRVFNKYLVHIFIILMLCYSSTLIIIQYNNYIISIIPGEIMSIDFSSAYGMWLLVIIMITGAFMFWYLIPREKAKKAQ